MKIQIIKEKHVLYDSLQSNRTHEQTCMISHLIAYLQGDVYVRITDKCFVAVNVKNFSTKSHNYYMVALESLLGMIKASRQLNMTQPLQPLCIARQVHQGFLKKSSCSQSFLIFLQQNQEMQPPIRMLRLIEISSTLIILIIYFFMFYITKIHLDAFKFKNYNSSKVIYYQKVIISHIRFINHFLNDSHPICITENGDNHEPYGPPWHGEGYVKLCWSIFFLQRGFRC